MKRAAASAAAPGFTTALAVVAREATAEAAAPASFCICIVHRLGNVVCCPYLSSLWIMNHIWSVFHTLLWLLSFLCSLLRTRIPFLKRNRCCHSQTKCMQKLSCHNACTHGLWICASQTMMLLERLCVPNSLYNFTLSKPMEMVLVLYIRFGVCRTTASN